jgi:geranylgeranyl diphosphate synthase, type I
MTPPAALDVEDLRPRVQDALDAFLERQRAHLIAVSPDLEPLLSAVGDLLRGGKRLRSAFCYWGWRGAGGEDSPGVVDVAAALEMFHAAALLHDDVMDASATRRGRPSAHQQLADLHRRAGWVGSPTSFGLAGGILAGDLCLTWSDEMYWSARLASQSLAGGRAVFERMRTELVAGQFLDMHEQAQETTTVERARRVIRYKSAQYSVEQPLLLGGALAGAGPELLDAYGAFGLALGEAFQLRDDVLGVFGDPQQTGKPAGDDLREGKRTALVAAALDRADEDEAGTVRRLLGDPRLDPAGVAELREVIVSTGALDEVEKLIGDRLAEALTTLDRARTTPPAGDVLRELAVAATARSV